VSGLFIAETQFVHTASAGVIADKGDAFWWVSGQIQGRHHLGNFRMSSFADRALFVLPIDIPDLPLSARAYYTQAELVGVSETEVPFTIRMHVVPEPSTTILALLTIIGMLLTARRKFARP
jgi:hypothetical protein